MSEDTEAQENELLALASIYDQEEFHRADSEKGGEIQICLELPPDFKVVVKGKPTSFSVRNCIHSVFLARCPCAPSSQCAILARSFL